MKITVFTSNRPRHLNLIERLSQIADEIAKESLDRKVGISEISRMIPKKQEIKDYFEPYYLGN